MKYATFSKSAFAVTAILVATACADSADVPEETAAPTEPAPTTTVPPAAKPPPPPEKTCATSCKADADCQSTCPALAGGVQCCDSGEGGSFKCFGSKTSTCPAPKQKPVDPPPAY